MTDGCVVCGKALKGSQRKFCCSKHNSKWHRENYSEPVRPVGCTVCGKPMEQSRFRPKKYCDETCRALGRKRRIKAGVFKEKIFAHASCSHCAEPFKSSYRDAKFCSDNCKSKHYYYSVVKEKNKDKPPASAEKSCTLCGHTYVGYAGTKFCSQKCHLTEMVSHHDNRTKILSSTTWMQI